MKGFPSAIHLQENQAVRSCIYTYWHSEMPGTAGHFNIMLSQFQRQNPRFERTRQIKNGS